MGTTARRIAAAIVLVLLASTGTAVAAGPNGKAATEKLVRRVLAGLPVLPRAKEHAKAVGGLTAPGGGFASPNEIDHARWWTAPGTVHQALKYYHLHPPAHTTLDGSGGTSGPHELTTYDLYFAGNDDYLQVVFELKGYHGWVAVRADVQAVWSPTRPGWSYVPKSATSVRATVVRKVPDGHGAPTVRRTLTGAKLTALVSLVDKLAVQPPTGPVPCPVTPPGTVVSDTLAFHTSSGSYVVTDTLTACGGIELQHGKRTVELAGSIDDAVLKALKLHAGYGER